MTHKVPHQYHCGRSKLGRHIVDANNSMTQIHNQGIESQPQDYNGRKFDQSGQVPRFAGESDMVVEYIIDCRTYRVPQRRRDHFIEPYGFDQHDQRCVLAGGCNAACHQKAQQLLF